MFTWATSRAKKESRRGKDWQSCNRLANTQSEKSLENIARIVKLPKAKKGFIEISVLVSIMET